MAVIEVNKISKRFGAKQALDKVSFKVGKGEIFGFLGPNGAGKTTTIRSIMDFIRPDSGTVSLFGVSSPQSAKVRQSVGYLSSDLELYDHWTARSHLKFFESIKGKNPSQESLVQRLGLTLDTAVRHLSSGNKQKLALALAFAGNPKLLVMDEPTRGLDPILQNELYVVLREFKEQGGTVFLSSHNLAEVQRVCDTVGIIREGELAALKSMDEIRELNMHVVSAIAVGGFTAADFQLPNVEITSYTKREITLKVRGDISPVIKVLCHYKLKDLEVSHLSLEDVFMEYYRG